MMSEYNFKIGEKVHYAPGHGKKENGIVKGFASGGNPFVVYKCGGDWDNYMNYTGANTNPRDLLPGWIPDKEPDIDIINDDYF